MRTHGSNLLIGAALAALAAGASADKLVPAQSIEDEIAIQDVRVDGNRVSGTIVNNSDSRISDVTLLVDYAWMWADEFNPGDDSPGFATRQTLPFTLNPGESATFTVEAEQPLAERDDGRFNPTVDVLGFTEYSPAR